MNGTWTLHEGDSLAVMRTLPEASVHCVVTSPPYWGLRDYGVGGQIGLEPTFGEHVAGLVAFFREVRRVLRPDGTLWMNYGDCYATSPNGRSAADTKAEGDDDRTFRDKPFSTIGGVLKPKDLCMMPHRLAIALQEDGWWVRCDIVWSKTNPMPESIADRPTRAHEYVFLLAKSERYFYDAQAIRDAAASPPREAVPSGWDTTVGEGGHGSIHRQGRSTTRKPIIRPSLSAVRKQDALGNRTHVGFNARYDESPVAGRNKRSVWEIPTEPYPDAHFATYPTRLVEPCILAGTSHKGACPTCGAPWKRIVAPTEDYARALTGDWSDRDQDEKEGRGHFIRPDGVRSGQRQSKRSKQTMNAEYVTAGWEPGCDHGESPVPCVVLDPFAGTSTTGEVALALGRSYVGIEINPESIALSKQRLILMPSYTGRTKRTSVRPDQMDLFAEWDG